MGVGTFMISRLEGPNDDQFVGNDLLFAATDTKVRFVMSAGGKNGVRTKNNILALGRAVFCGVAYKLRAAAVYNNIVLFRCYVINYALSRLEVVSHTIGREALGAIRKFRNAGIAAGTIGHAPGRDDIGGPVKSDMGRFQVNRGIAHGGISIKVDLLPLDVVYHGVISVVSNRGIQGVTGELYLLYVRRGEQGI